MLSEYAVNFTGGADVSYGPNPRGNIAFPGVWQVGAEPRLRRRGSTRCCGRERRAHGRPSARRGENQAGRFFFARETEIRGRDPPLRRRKAAGGRVPERETGIAHPGLGRRGRPAAGRGSQRVPGRPLPVRQVRGERQPGDGPRHESRGCHGARSLLSRLLPKRFDSRDDGTELRLPKGDEGESDALGHSEERRRGVVSIFPTTVFPPSW